MTESTQKNGFGRAAVALSRRCLRWPRRKLMGIFRSKKSRPPRAPHMTQSAVQHHRHHATTAEENSNGNIAVDKEILRTDAIMWAPQGVVNSSVPQLSGGESSTKKGDRASAAATSGSPSAAMNGGVEKKKDEEKGVDGKQTTEKKDKPEGAANAPKLSNAELKKRAKAEKAARRAKEKQEREQQAGPAAQSQAGQQPGGPKKGDNKQSQKKGEGQKAQKQGAGPAVVAQRRGSVHVPAAEAKKKKKKAENENIVAVFGHLPWHSRRAGIAGVGKEIHPAVVALGMQLRDYVICGSSARCVATLLALRRVVQAYITPIGTSLSRNLTTYLSHQINYLTTCRPLAISQGNAIRALKLEITTIDPGDSEDEAKQQIYDYIDNYIREKYTVASQVIANSAAEKIKDGDVILCYANSSVVQKALLTAHAQGKKFRVFIVDTRPLFEGKNLARTLSKAGLEVQYSLINGIAYAIREATKVFLGAHAMTSNGCLFSRVGTALVAMSAKERVGGIDIPVIVCCETAKFTDRVALDSIVVNEIAEADDLVGIEPSEQVTQLSPPTPAPTRKGGSTKSAGANADTSSLASSLGPTSLVTDHNRPLQNWREMKHLQLLNIMHDVTPAQYIDMVITEMGSLPPSAVPIVHRMSTESEDSKHY
ncbi:Initiation factor 2 subunit family protein [Coccidioides posadasii C735 delta SOWgp]|nr:Initiation factor 2 subunit family protein [Coccidioides posadasii C735 delta SOWgp]EER25068.1 Initiation factor 2 subunit family protein [Coccidioides posadasii C735 delta SOWgp]|eukprot:XP_003067213.1 Initiation factor 2 subunit family protein [Coccidioides posadasii C735 delta SOWgp]